ncbi:MAG: hypothetical protein SOZ59_06930 [Candidatus Limivivens sp.]|nr:hypothetical protein [Candidatus Limivivens sp.]
MNHIKRAKRNKPDPLCQELQAYYREGIRLWLDGRPSNPRQIARACSTGEECSYMRDYIRDDEGEILGIGFDHVEKN